MNEPLMTAFDEKMLWWKAVSMKSHFDEKLLWWKDASMKSCFNEKLLWWKGASMKSCFDEKPFRWKAALMKSHFDEKPPHQLKIVIFMHRCLTMYLWLGFCNHNLRHHFPLFKKRVLIPREWQRFRFSFDDEMRDFGFKFFHRR